MQLKDYLNSLSIDDLRELADRRRIPIPEGPGSGRQTLVRILSASLDRPDSVYSATSHLNQGELGVLHAVVAAGKQAGISALARSSGVDAELLKGHLESLRLYGLLFPEGNWEHIALPNATKNASTYLPGRRAEPLAQLVTPPMLEPGPEGKCKARPGSIGRDMAEMLARIARGRLKLTQAGRMNKRDLKGMEPAFGIQTDGYSWFLYVLTSSTPMIAATKEGLLVVQEDADAFLSQPEAARAGILSYSWTMLRAYPETVAGDPKDYDYVPMQLPDQRTLALSILTRMGSGPPVTVSSFVAALVWHMPLSFQGWNASVDPGKYVPRLLRSLYWLGLAALDHPEKPKYVQCAPLTLWAMRPPDAPPPEAPELIPEDPRFFIQPNAEVFAPPNVSPRALFHLRRVTGEKKGAPEGVYPLTADSIRRALDTGLTVGAITTFLEKFSRTGLPSNVRSLVETTGRQHGRIRLIPTGYVLVTDEPQLLEELRRVKPIEPLLGKGIAERVTAVDARQVNELMRTLRQKGYAPLNQEETGDAPTLPDDPEVAPDLFVEEDEPGLTVLGPDGQPVPEAELAQILNQLLISELGGREPVEPADLPPPAHTQPDIHSLLSYAADEGMWVEVEYQPNGAAQPETWELLPDRVTKGKVWGMTYDDMDNEIEEVLDLKQVTSARLTGEYDF